MRLFCAPLICALVLLLSACASSPPAMPTAGHTAIAQRATSVATVAPTMTRSPAAPTPSATAVKAMPTATVEPTPTETIALPTDTPPLPTATPPLPTDTPLPPTATPIVLVPVVDVVDGDTIKVDVGGRVETIRIIGLDTPETKDPRKPVQCFGEAASAKAHELLDGQSVRLVADVSQGERDKYDRLLRYVELADGTDYGLWMIAHGYAHEYTYDLPYERQAVYKAAQVEAMENERGFWSPTTCAGDTTQPAEEPTATNEPAALEPTSTPAPATQAPAANCDPSYPDVCIPPPPPDLDCGDIPYRRFRVLPPDPHNFDGRDQDGIGCES